MEISAAKTSARQPDRNRIPLLRFITPPCLNLLRNVCCSMQDVSQSCGTVKGFPLWKNAFANGNSDGRGQFFHWQSVMLARLAGVAPVSPAAAALPPGKMEILLHNLRRR